VFTILILSNFKNKRMQINYDSAEQVSNSQDLILLMLAINYALRLYRNGVIVALSTLDHKASSK